MVETCRDPRISGDDASGHVGHAAAAGCRRARAPHAWRARHLGAAAGSIAATVLALVLVAAAAAAQPKLPPLSGRIVDEAALLKPEDRRSLEQDLRALEEKSTDQLVIYTARSLQGYPIEDFGYQLGRAWGIGQQGKNNGAILLVAPNERKVRIEVGRGLEPQLTDLMTKLIIENAILPAFRRGDFPAGIKAGVRDIRDVLLGDAEAVKERARGGKQRSPDPHGGLAVAVLILFILVAFTIVWVQSQQTAYPMSAADRRRRRARDARSGWDTGWGGSSGGWGGWSGGGSGGGGGGGGFSGGGGDFGGGGSSGSW
jgi:uncharacterized protein